ncbi:sodium ion-translocating decarboxylase subunit beta, partial [Salmonella enterica subsp. enterica serovar Montevideo]|nr:sodium ion-translocating decarboxylase subunit beta [Salmonella enterica subsp. enterica serovar Montevideo]
KKMAKVQRTAKKSRVQAREAREAVEENKKAQLEAGVSAVPMAARVSNKVGLESDAQNFLLMHAMGPNVAGVIGSAIAAGVMLKYVLAM